MEELFKQTAGAVAISVELVAALLIAYGAVEALSRLLIPTRRYDQAAFANRRQVFLHFGVWLLLGLEFELAADIVRTAITPSWSQIGQLGAIAVIRTFLNYFLEKDVKELEAAISRPEPAPKTRLVVKNAAPT